MSRSWSGYNSFSTAAAERITRPALSEFSQPVCANASPAGRCVFRGTFINESPLHLGRLARATPVSSAMY
jgi:hypothetical protein